MKRILAILMALVMVLSMVNVTWAADDHADDHGAETWEKLTVTSGQLTGGKSYYLDDNVTLTDQLTVNSGTVNLCLNGKVLNGNSKRTIVVKDGDTLNIYDCPGDSQYYFVESDTGLWELTDNAAEADHTVEGGIITGGKSGNGAVTAWANSTLNIYGGTIVGNENTATSNNGGGGICITGGSSGSATLHMYGGAVIGNRSEKFGGGIYLNVASATIGENVVIANNTAVRGGGIYMNGNATLTGGNIQYNNATESGGGIYVGSNKDSTTAMTGVTISNNTAVNQGGGLYLAACTLNMNSCTITANTAQNAGGLSIYGSTSKLTMDADSVVTDNMATNNTTEANRYMANDIHMRDGDHKLAGTMGGVSIGNGITASAGVEITGKVGNLAISEGVVEVSKSSTVDTLAVCGGTVGVNGALSYVQIDEAYGPLAAKVTLGETATVSGNVAITGGETTIAGEVSGSVNITQAETHDGSSTVMGTPSVTVSNTATVKQEVNVSGGDVNINGTVQGSVTVQTAEKQDPAGLDTIPPTVSIGNTAAVTGKVEVSGGEAKVEGTVSGGMNVTGGKTEVSENATVTGEVTVSGGDVVNNNPNVDVTVDTENMTNGSAVDKDKVLVAKSDTNAATLEAAKMSQATTMNVTVNGVNLVFDGDATTMVKGSANGADVTVTVEKLADQTGLTNEQQEQLKNREVKGIYNITLTTNGTPATEITNFSAGKLIVTIPYEKTEGKNVKFYCVTDTGMESIPAKYQDGELIATLSHLSTYAIVEYTPSSGGGYVPSGHYVTSPFTGVDKVYVDGALVDAKNYTVSGGNVTLLQSYLDGLKGGNHTIKIVYGSRQATGTFTTKGTGVVQSAKTFDAGIALYAGMALMSAAGAVYVTKKHH